MQAAFETKTLVPAEAEASCAGGTSNVTQIQPLVSDTISELHGTIDIDDAPKSCGCNGEKSFWKRLNKESIGATLMVVKFMALAFFLEAIIILYVPEDWITSVLGKENSSAILIAGLLGVPVYTSNLSALPMVSGPLSQGMNLGAALAFLIAGPTTTLPAMAAVWTLVENRIFILYVSYALAGGILLGYLKGFF